MKDYYQILGISRSASASVIKNAYRRLVILYHPDKNPDPRASEVIRDINEAYDVLGDQEKRQAYDFRYNNQSWTDLPPQAPVHRDPAYRRRRPPVSRPSDIPDQVHLMNQFMPFTKWFSYIGLAVTILLVVDLVLPYRASMENVYKVYHRPYCIVRTYSGREIKIYDGADAGSLMDERVIRVYATVFFSIPMVVTDKSQEKVARLGYIYKNFVFMPFTLFMVSLLGVTFRKTRRLFSFNLSISSALLLIINLYLILTQ
jgi:hypothetical protein